MTDEPRRHWQFTLGATTYYSAADAAKAIGRKMRRQQRLIESQQARIDALERIIRTRTEVSGHNPYGLSEADADLLRSIIEDAP